MSCSRLAAKLRLCLALVLLLSPRAALTQPTWMWVPTDLGTLGGASSRAADINDGGQFVGWVGAYMGNYHAVLWERQYVEPLSVTALTSNVTFPVVAGSTSVTWTASATAGVPPYTFQYWIFDGATWQVARDWSASASWTWEPLTPGTYTVQVWARNAGSSGSYNAWRNASAIISAPSALTIIRVTPSVATVPAGTEFSWTVTALGGTGPYTYQFFVYDGTAWTIGQNWSTANTWWWRPPAAGTYAFQVWARNAGSATAYDAWRGFGPYTATRPASLTATGLAPDQTLPVPGGTPVTWTATAAGGTGPYTYKFWKYCPVSHSCVLAQDWSESNTFTWIWTGGAGPPAITVWVRNAGSTAPDDAATWTRFPVSEPAALQVSLASDRTFPVPAGTPVNWTARGRGGAGPYTYKFWVFDGSTWSVGKDWSASPTWTWLPSSPGSYFVQAWARNAGSSTAYDAWTGTAALGISSAMPLQIAGLTTAPMTPLFASEPAVVTATAVGGTGPYSYQFWVYDGSAWMLGQQWGPSSTYTWWSTAAGTYWIHAWVRNAGTSSWDAGQGLGPLTVLP